MANTSIPVRPFAFKPDRQLWIEDLIGELCVAIRDVEKRRDERDIEDKALARFRRETAAKKAIVDAFMGVGS